MANPLPTRAGNPESFPSPGLYDPPGVYDPPGGIGNGVAGALGLHLLVGAALVAAAFLGHHDPERWGELQASVGAIQASMVSAIPLPSLAKPVEKQVLASEDEGQSPPPPPPPSREAAEPPPKPTDILIKAKTPPKPAPKPAPVRAEAPPKPQPKPHPEAPPKPKPRPTSVAVPSARRPIPTPPTPKAQTGETAATQLPQAVSQLKNGTATATVQDRAFGTRYAYYLRLVSQKVSQNWVASEADPRSSQGKRVTLLFDIDRDGTPGDIRVETRSTSPSLDGSALHAVGRIDSFGPLPAGNKITIEFSFDYRAP